MKWINTEEQRPKDGQYILYVFDPGRKGGHVFLGRYYADGDTVSGYAGFTTIDPEVPYWMPCPEPPNETN